MKVNPSLTAAITAAALVTGIGFVYAQSTAPSPAADPMAPGSTMQQAPSPSTDNSTEQAQPPSSSGTSLDNSATPSGMATTTPEPRADRN